MYNIPRLINYKTMKLKAELTLLNPGLFLTPCLQQWSPAKKFQSHFASNKNSSDSYLTDLR